MLNTIRSAAKAVTELAGDTLATGVEKLKGSLDELSAASGDLEQVGYRIGQIELICSLPPRVVVFLSRHGSPTPEAFQAVLARHADNQTVKTVVGLLQTAEGMVKRVQLQGRRCTQLAVELGLPPSLRLIYDSDPASPESAPAG